MHLRTLRLGFATATWEQQCTSHSGGIPGDRQRPCHPNCYKQIITQLHEPPVGCCALARTFIFNKQGATFARRRWAACSSSVDRKGG